MSPTIRPSAPIEFVEVGEMSFKEDTPCIGCGKLTYMGIPYTCCKQCSDSFENIIKVAAKDPHFTIRIIKGLVEAHK
jgi:hypothetical protein